MNSEGSQTSSLKSRFWRDENFFKSSFCAEFFAARPADQTIRFSSMDDIFLKMSFCTENPPLKPQASTGKSQTTGKFSTLFLLYFHLTFSNLCYD